MSGTISSIGLGSDGAISSDILDQLRKVEESNIVTPIDNDLETNSLKQNSLDTIITTLSSLKSFASSLSDDSLYLERVANVTGSNSVSVSVDSGVTPQEMEITVNQLAKGDVIQSDAMDSQDEVIADSDTTLEINVGGTDYSIDVEAGTTLSELVQLLNDKDIGVKASTLNTGPNEYRLILKSEELGEDGAITIAENDDLTTNLSSEENRVQTAQNAEFTYNGISITRSSNTVEDLVLGVSIQLLNEDENASYVSIEQETDLIIEEAQNFVSMYNDLLSTLSTATDYDEDTDSAGVFQGESNIRTIKSDLNRALMAIESDGESLATYGISFNDAGTLELSTSTLASALENDPDSVKEFFQGVDKTDRYGIKTHMGGVFYSINDIIDGYVGSEGKLTYFNTSLSDSYNNLVEERERAMSILDTRYEMMATRFAAYDSIIGTLTNSFESLNMMIQSELSGD